MILKDMLKENNIEIPPELNNRDNLADAWVEFAEATEDPTVVKAAIANLKASLGALRNEEAAWRDQGQDEQSILKKLLSFSNLIS